MFLSFVVSFRIVFLSASVWLVSVGESRSSYPILNFDCALSSYAFVAVVMCIVQWHLVFTIVYDRGKLPIRKGQGGGRATYTTMELGRYVVFIVGNRLLYLTKRKQTWFWMIKEYIAMHTV